MPRKPKMLMHVCCATCALHPCVLLKEDYDLTLYYFNPNIHPRQEYKKRLDGVRFISARYNIPLMVGKYQKNRWLKATEGLEGAPEGGERCITCFKLRLFDTARQAKKLGFDKFCTTLSVSPHKDAGAINQIGRDAARYFKTGFLEKDFKKKDGFKKTILMSKQLNLYRQDYCGCIYSKR